ncbi:MAG: GGDEF domain-containing protein [Desulfobacteraceae bacterium]|nr:GGDEF domain-containing protein [Desulfobacteraceae bacterium]
MTEKKSFLDKYSYLSIKTRLSFFLTLILIIGFMAINILNYNLCIQTLKNSIKKDSLPGIANEIYHDIQKKFNSAIQTSSLMASDTFLKDWIVNGEKDISKIKEYLYEIKKKYGFFSSFLVSGQTLNYYHFKGLHKTISKDDQHDIWYYNFLKSGYDYDLDVDNDEASSGTLTIFINHRLNDLRGNYLGVTGVGLKMNNIGQLLHTFEENYDKSVYFTDKSGLIQAHSDQSLIQKTNIKKQRGISEIAENILTENASFKVNEYKNSKNQDIILISKYIPEFNWFLIVEHKSQTSINKIKNIFLLNIAIGISVTILVIIINIFIINYYQGRLEQYASRDELTDLFNRRYFYFLAKRDIAQAQRSKTPISILMFDIDFFKEINDNFGHDKGDKILREVADTIKPALRNSDLSARIGGDEFAVIMTNTDKNGAYHTASRLSSLISSINITDFKGLKKNITISVGVATITNCSGKDVEYLLLRADQQLYKSKKTGRNKISVYEE